VSSPLRVLLPGFRGTALPAWLRARLEAGLAGVCLFADNLVDDDQAAALTAQIRAANPDAVVAVDEEGGDVTRLAARTGSPYPGNAVLGRLDDVHLTARVARAVARRLAAAGVTLNLAPVADVNTNPCNPVIGVRSFGSDAGLAARHVAAWTEAHEAVGVATSLKHFPGHGDVAVDSHLDRPVLDVDPGLLRSRELAPFRAGIDAGARTVMTSHIVVSRIDPTEPATFSAPVLGGLLRDELGFTGVVVSDALDMRGASGRIGVPAAAVRALAAGVDLLCLGPGTTEEQLAAVEAEIAAAVGTGALSPARLAEAASRVARLARSVGARPVAPDRDGDLPDPARLVAAFDVRPGAAPPAGARIVQIGTSPNVAVGGVPWGPAATGITVDMVRPGDALPTGPLVLVGRDNHRHPWVRALVDEARRAGPTLVVDMGWPSPDRSYADVATFGASRAVGAALVEWLRSHGWTPPPRGHGRAPEDPGAAR
jgi:beta-N-acetylhexosaminidase